MNELSASELTILLVDTTVHLVHDTHPHMNKVTDIKHRFLESRSVAKSSGSRKTFTELRDYYAENNCLDEFIQIVHGIDHSNAVFDGDKLTSKQKITDVLNQFPIV